MRSVIEVRKNFYARITGPAYYFHLPDGEDWAPLHEQIIAMMYGWA